MVLDAALLSSQHYKVRIKGKVEQSREGERPPLHLSVEAIEKEPSGRPRLRSLTLLIYFTPCLFPNFISRYYLPTPPLGQDMTQGQFLSGV